MKSILIAILFMVISIPAWSDVNLHHGTVICSGTDESDVYFTLVHEPREGQEQMFILDVTTSWSNDSSPLYISEVKVDPGTVTYTFEVEQGSAADPMALEVDLRTGKSLFKNYDDYAIELVCKSSAKTVDSVLDFIEANGLPAPIETESESYR